MSAVIAEQWECIGDGNIVLNVVRDWSGIMSDLINREGAMDILGKLSPLDKSGILEVVRWGIENLPSVQPEIIYCKDCKYSHMTIDGLCKYCDIWFPNEEMYEDGNHFCASAEKR